MQTYFLGGILLTLCLGGIPLSFAEPVDTITDPHPSPRGGPGVEESLTIEQAVSEGLKSNLDILATQYGIPLAEADEITAGLWNNPAVLFDTVFQPLHGGNWNQTNAGGPRQYDMIFSYPLDLSGKRSKAKR